MYPVRVKVLLPTAFVTFSVTVYVPFAEYLWEGFLSVDVLPSPKVHTHEVGELVDVSVNATVSGNFPVVGVPVKLATGATAAVLTVM